MKIDRRPTLRRLIRANGLKVIAGAIGLDPGTLAKYQAGENGSGRTRSAIERAFAQLGPSLAFERWRGGGGSEAPKRSHLRLVQGEEAGRE